MIDVMPVGSSTCWIQPWAGSSVYTRSKAYRAAFAAHRRGLQVCPQVLKDPLDVWDLCWRHCTVCSYAWRPASGQGAELVAATDMLEEACSC